MADPACAPLRPVAAPKGVAPEPLAAPESGAPAGPVVLASGSPRRREILAALGIACTVQPADVDESVLPGEAPAAYVDRLARAKAAAVAALAVAAAGPDPAALVIAADTTVVVDGDILGKPTGPVEARAMLHRLSGRVHEVLTGVAVAHGATVESGVETTRVTFAPIADPVVEWYVALPEPYDKAGGYGLQGAGAAFVEGVEGNVANVIGLPVPLLLRLAAAVGRPLLPPPG